MERFSKITYSLFLEIIGWISIAKLLPLIGDQSKYTVYHDDQLDET